MMIIVELFLRIIKFDYIDGQYWEQINTFVGIKAKYLYIMYICMYFFWTENGKSCGIQ